MRIQYFGWKSPVKEFLGSVETLVGEDPELIVSYNYDKIFDVNKLSCPAINLHISFLPWNRGAHPNVWSWIDNTYKGFTIHFIDSGIDTGRYILREESVYMLEDCHTLKSSYLFLHAQLQRTFMTEWEKIKDFITYSPKVGYDQLGKGSYHNLKDLDKYRSCMVNGWDTPINAFLERVAEMQLSINFCNKILEEEKSG